MKKIIIKGKNYAEIVQIISLFYAAGFKFVGYSDLKYAISMFSECNNFGIYNPKSADIQLCHSFDVKSPGNKILEFGSEASDKYFERLLTGQNPYLPFEKTNQGLEVVYTKDDITVGGVKFTNEELKQLSDYQNGL